MGSTFASSPERLGEKRRPGFALCMWRELPKDQKADTERAMSGFGRIIACSDNTPHTQDPPSTFHFPSQSQPILSLFPPSSLSPTSASSSPMSPSASTLIALASPSFIALFLLPHTVALVLKFVLSLSHSPRSIFHRPYYHKATFTLPALSSFSYAVGGVFSLLGIARYAQDGAESSLERGFRVAQGATQAIGRFGVIVCLLVLLSTFGPRSNKRSSRAHLAPFTTIIVAILFALGLASLTLSIYLSVALSNRDVSTTTPIRILSVTQPSLLLATLLLTLFTFVLLFTLFNVAAAISRPDQNRGSFAEDFLASKATQYGVRPASTATFPPPRLLRHLHYSSTIFRIAPRIVVVTLVGLVGAGLQLADCLLDRDMLDAIHIGLSIGKAVCEVVWIGGVVQIFYGLCQPRPKAQRTYNHTTEAEEDPTSNPHLPPSSSGHHLLHARHQNQSPSLSPVSQDSHRDSAASTTLPHTPATPAFPVAPKAALFDGIPPGSTESGSQSYHHNYYGSTTNANAGIPTLPASSSTMNALGGGGGGSAVGSLTYFATLSEELLALRTDDPFSSPPPGTVVLPKLPPSGTVRRRRGVVVGKAETEARPATAPVSAKPKTKTRPRRSSTGGSLSDGCRPGDEIDSAAPESSRGPSSKKAKTAAAGEGAKLSKRTSAKPTFSRRPSNKRRRSGGVGKVKKEAPAETTTTTNNRVLHFGDLPSLVPGATRPRPPRNPIPRFSQQIEGVNSLGLIVDDQQSMPPPGLEDARQPTFIALDTTTDDTRLLKSVVANALGLNRHQHIQYLEPTAAAAAVLPQEAVSRADCGLDGGGDREHPSGSTTPTPQRQEDARLTARGASPTPDSNGSPLRQVMGQKEFKFTTLVDSPTSPESAPHVPFPDPTTIYQRPDLEGPSMLHNPTAVLLETFPRTPSFADASMSITSSSAASDVQTQATLSPAQTNSSSFMRTTFNPPSSFEASAPIDIPAAGPSAAARTLYRRRGLSTSILEATRAIPIVPPPSGGGRGARLHKPNSNSYDAARVRAHLLMAGAEQRQDTATDETNRSAVGLGRNSTERLWSTRILREPAPTDRPARAQQLPPPPPSTGSLDLPLLHSRFSDPATTGTGSSGERTCSTAGVDAGSESSFK